MKKIVEVGSVYKILYFTILPNKKRRLLKFNGLCIKFNKKTFSASFTNKIMEDRILITLDLFSPSIVEILKLKNFSYPSRLLRIVKFPNNFFLPEKFNNDRFFFKGLFNFNVFYFLLRKSNNKSIRKKFRLKK